MKPLRELDDQEKTIVRMLVRNPRATDNWIAEQAGLNVRTVNRKRKRLEEEGLLSYYAVLDVTTGGTGQYNSRHLYMIRFRIGITYQQLLDDIRTRPFGRAEFSRIIYESHLAEIDGRVALLLTVDGTGAAEIVQTVHEKVIPIIHQMHGSDSIESISTLRILSAVRILRNYMPTVNIEQGYVRDDWPEENIYVCD